MDTTCIYILLHIQLCMFVCVCACLYVSTFSSFENIYGMNTGTTLPAWQKD